MISVVERRGAEIAEICAKHRVRRLELFGSGASGQSFDGARSDLDFLVEFHPLDSGAKAATYFNLLEALRSLFGRDIDLVVTRALTNPYFLRAIEGTREIVYED